MGLPTSTTVSLIFCLLGSAIAVSIYKISNDGALGMGDLNHFINTGRAMGIVSAILLSVVIAFTFGTLIMYISRLIFSFRYTAMFRRYGSLWCGASLTAILYFAVFKGLKTPLAGSDRDRMDRPHILSLPLFVLGRRQPAAVLPPASQGQHSAPYDPLGNLCVGPRLRRQRPGELHRRAR